jgi:hypothetical protein
MLTIYIDLPFILNLEKLNIFNTLFMKYNIQYKVTNLVLMLTCSRLLIPKSEL